LELVHVTSFAEVMTRVLIRAVIVIYAIESDDSIQTSATHT